MRGNPHHRAMQRLHQRVVPRKRHQPSIDEDTTMPAIILDLGDGYAIASLDRRPIIARIFTDLDEAEEFAFEAGIDLVSYEED